VWVKSDLFLDLPRDPGKKKKKKKKKISSNFFSSNRCVLATKEAMADDELVTLLAQGQQVVLSVKEAKLMGTLADAIEDSGVENPIPIPDTDIKSLMLVVLGCQKLVESPPEDQKAAAAAFVMTVNPKELLSFMVLANYLDARLLLGAAADAGATALAGNRAFEMRDYLGVKKRMGVWRGRTNPQRTYMGGAFGVTRGTQQAPRD